MYSIDSGKKEVTLTIKNGNVIQNIRVPYEGASYYVKEFLISFYDMYERHKHAYKIKERIGTSGLTPSIDWRDFSNLVYKGLLRKAYNAIQFGKADEALVTNAMDVANCMFAEIHEFYRNHQG